MFRVASFVFRRLVDEVHELVELRRDDDLRASVALLAHFAVVACDGVLFASSPCREAFRVNAVLVLQCLHYA